MPRNHPDFSKKLKHLQQSDPVNPRDLAQRLQLFLAEQSAYPDGVVPRRVRRPRTSTTNSEITSGPPTPPQNPLRNSFLPDSFRHNLDFQKFVDNAAGNHLATTSNRPDSATKNFAYPIPVAVLSPPSARHSAEISNESSLYLTTTSSANFPANPRTSRIEPLKADIFHAQDEPVPFMGGNGNIGQRPKSTLYTAGGEIAQTTTPIAAKRKTIHMIPQHAQEEAFESLPFLTIDPLSPLRSTFFSDAPQNTVVNSPGSSAFSPGARTSITTDSTFANYMTAPTSPAAPPINSINSIAPPTAEVTSRLEKRRSWHPRSLMASMKPTRGEPNDRRQTEFQTTAVMVEAARQGQAKEVKIMPRPKSTAFENFSAGSFRVPDCLGTGGVPPIPALDQSTTKDTKVVRQDKETPVKESIWNRRSRRKTIGAEEAEKPKYVATSMPTVDKLRWKQLAMREKALADSKKSKGDRNTSVKSLFQTTEDPNLDLPTTVPDVYEPKKRVTRPLTVVPPPTTSTQTSRQRHSSPTNRSILQKPTKPQEMPHSPVEVRPISRPCGEDCAERSTSRYYDSESMTTSPLVLSLGVSSLPRGVHLLDDTPTSIDGIAGTDRQPEDSDHGAKAHELTSPVAEANPGTIDRLKPLRDPSKPKLLLGPFPPSSPTTPSTSPHKKPLPQLPRSAPVVRKPYTLQPPTRTLDIPDSLGSPTHEQQRPKHAREVSITKVASAPRIVSAPAISPALEISSPREIAQWEILPPREAPAPRDDLSSSREQKSPALPQLFDFGTQSPKHKTSFDPTSPKLDRKGSQPILKQNGESPPRPRASSIDPSKALSSRTNLNTLRPKTSAGLPTPIYTIEVLDNEIAEMTPASVKLLREQQSILRRRALAAAAVHSDPNAASKRSTTPLAELLDRARATTLSPTTANANKSIARSTTPLAGPGSIRNPHSSHLFIDASPRVSLDRQGRIQTHLGSGAAETNLVRAPLDSKNPPARKKSILLPSHTTQYSTTPSIGIPAVTPTIPHVSGTKMVEEMKMEREREINANRAKYGLPGPGRRSTSIPFVEEKLSGQRTEAEKRTKRKGRDKWWKIWRVV